MESSNYYKPKGSFNIKSKFLSLFGNLRKPSFKKVIKIFVYFLLALIIILIISFIVIGLPLLGLYKDAMALKNQARSLKDAASEQNLTQVGQSLISLKEGVAGFEGKYESRLSLIKNLPFAKEYYEDGKHALKAANYALDLGSTTVKMIEPFASDLGFKVEGKEFENSELTNQERLIKILKLLPEFSLEVDNIAEATRKIDEELSQINETKYPL